MRATSVSLNTHCVVPENVNTPPTPKEIWFETFNSSENFKRVCPLRPPPP